jgi:CBS domain-containing protein
MKTVRQLLQAKGGAIHSVSPDTRVFEALKLMAEKEIGALVVTDGGALVGIMSERDYARKVILHGKSSHDIPVRDIMTSQVLTVTPGQTVDQCMALMTSKRFRHVPVESNGKLSGIISIGDVVKTRIAAVEREAEEIKAYIAG